MAQRRWTVVVLPPGARKSRSIEFSLLGVRVILGCVAAVVLATLVLGYTAISKAVALSNLDRLERRNELLAEELSQTQRLIALVGDSVAVIAERDRKMRLLAGLEPTDPEVQRAGIGGPVGEWTEREQILSEGQSGRTALEMRSYLAGLIRRANLLAASFGAAAESLEIHHDVLLRTPSIMPTAGWRTSRFAEQRLHPIYHEDRPHEGIDIAAPVGTPILATAAGTVRNVYNNGGYGLMVVIYHGRGVVTRYAHLSKFSVHVGQQVKRGDNIGEVGKTGIATAPHLHYEVLEYGRAVDPKLYILPKAIVD